MYFAIFGTTVALTAVFGVAAATALIYDYIAFKQRERQSVMDSRLYSVAEPETFERNSENYNQTHLHRRKHRTDINRGSSAYNRIEPNVRGSNENMESMSMITEYSARDNKKLDDVIRNSECSEKRFEKNVFDKMKNDLTNLNQNYEEKEILEKNIIDSSYISCGCEVTKTVNSHLESNPSVSMVGEIPKDHGICLDGTCHNSLDNLNDVICSEEADDECNAQKIDNIKPNCLGKNELSYNQSTQNVLHPNETDFKNDVVHQSDRREINFKSSNCDKINVLNDNICDHLCLPNSRLSKMHKNIEYGVEHKFDDNGKKAHIKCDIDHFEKQKESIKILNVDSSIAGSQEHLYCSLQSASATLPTVRLKGDTYHSNLQSNSSVVCSPSSSVLTKNKYCSSLQSSSSQVSIKETCTEGSDYLKLYNCFQKQNVSDGNTICKGKTKVLNDYASAEDCVLSESAVNISLNSSSNSRLSFNTISKIKTSKHIDLEEFHNQNKERNVGVGNSNYGEKISVTSIDAGDQHPALSSTSRIEYPKNSIHLKAAECKFDVSVKERGFPVNDYQVNNRSKIISENRSSSFASHLSDKYMPGIQNYVSSIRNYVKKHEAVAFLLGTNSSNSSNTVSSSIESDTEIIEPANDSIGIQASLVCETISEELKHANKPPHNLCKGCMEVLANTVSVPCGHSCLCIQCAEITLKVYNKCCICQNRVTSYKHNTI